MGQVVIRKISQPSFLHKAEQFVSATEEKDASSKKLEYKGLTLPGVIQSFGPRYSESKGMYPYDEEYITKEQLLEYVKEVSLSDRKTGLPIQDINHRNRNDAFLIHDEFKVRIGDGTLTLDDDLKINKLKLAFLRKHDFFKVMGENKRGAIYEIGVVKDANEKDSSAANKELDAFAHLHSMNREKLLSIIKIFTTKSPNADVSDNVLRASVMSELKRVEKFNGKSRIDVFLEFAKNDDATQNLKTLVAELIEYRIVRKGAANKFTFHGAVIASNEAGVYDYFLNGRNSHDAERATKELEDRKNNFK
jgi:hypothetical protein